MNAVAGSGLRQQGQYLTFQLRRELLGIGILSIREIIEYQSPTDVPMMPPCIRGVINLRGAVVPVVDLALRLGREGDPPGRRTCVVIVEMKADEGPLVLGLIVDAVSEVLEIPADEILPPPEFGASVDTQYIEAMARVNGRFVILLDVDRVLSLATLKQAQDVAPAV